MVKCSGLIKRSVILLSLIGASLALPAQADGYGGHYGGGHWESDGWGWMGIGLGLAWQAAYYGNPYLYNPYPGYAYQPYGPPEVIINSPLAQGTTMGGPANTPAANTSLATASIYPITFLSNL